MANSTLTVTYKTKKTGTGTQDLTKEMGAAKLSLADMKAGLDMAGAAFGAVKAAVQSVIDPTVEYAGQIRELQRTIGATAEESSKLIQAADDVGISAGTVQAAMEAAIKKGVRPTIAGIADLADQYNAIQDPIARTKFLMDKFGKAGADMGALMELVADGIKAAGDEAERMGLVMGQDGVDNARAYEMAMDDFNDSVLAVKLAIAQGLLPAVTGAIKQGAEYVQVWKNVFQAMGDGRLTLVDYLKTSAEVVWTDKTLADVNAELTQGYLDQKAALEEVDPAVQNARLATEAASAAAAAHDASISAETARLQGLADMYETRTTPAAYGYLDATGLLSAGLAGLTEQMIFNQASMGLSAEAALQLGINMGLVDSRVLALNEALPALKAKFDANKNGAIDAGAETAGYAAAVERLNAALLATPPYVESTVVTNFVSNGTNYGGPAGPPQGPIPQADGGDWMVTEPTLFLAGEAGPERATFTPLGGGGGGGGNGLTIQNLTINAPGATANELYAMLQANDIRRRTGARS